MSNFLRFKIGKVYYRPSVLIAAQTERRQAIRVPILHSHTGDISGDDHHHIDWRFVDEDLEKLIGHPKEGVIGVPPYEVQSCGFTCVRDQVFPQQYSRNQLKDFQKIETNCQDRTLDLNKMLCPHQGCEIAQNCKQMIDGQLAYVCSCHGLAWDAETGKQVPRTASLKASNNV